MEDSSDTYTNLYVQKIFNSRRLFFGRFIVISPNFYFYTAQNLRCKKYETYSMRFRSLQFWVNQYKTQKLVVGLKCSIKRLDIPKLKENFTKVLSWKKLKDEFSSDPKCRQIWLGDIRSRLGFSKMCLGLFCYLSGKINISIILNILHIDKVKLFKISSQ